MSANFPKDQKQPDMSFLKMKVDEKDQEAMVLVNRARKKEGRKLLCKNDRLIEASRIHNEEMKKLKSLTHDDLEGNIQKGGDPVGKRLARLGVTFKSVGENVAQDFKRPEQMVKSWTESPSHMANILNDQYNVHGLASNKEGYTTHTFAEIPNKVCTEDGLVDKNLAQSIFNQKAKSEKIYGQDIEIDEYGRPILDNNKELLSKVVQRKRESAGQKNFQIDAKPVKVGSMVPPLGNLPSEKSSDADFSCCTGCDEVKGQSKSIFDDLE